MIIHENKKSWSIISLSKQEMKVLVSMIRLTVGSGDFDPDAGAIPKEDCDIAFDMLSKINEAY